MARDGGVAGERQRVFFALWPQDDVRAALGAAARRMHRVLHGRRMRDENLHLTLAFLGDVDFEDYARLQLLPSSLLVAQFGLVLDRWDCWPRNGIGWAGPSQVPAPLRDLARNLDAWLRDQGFSLDTRPFTPHVTLVRDAQYAAMPEPLPPIDWPVKDLALVRSLRLPRGVQYEVVRRWELPGA